jgi:hypothetical protein
VSRSVSFDHGARGFALGLTLAVSGALAPSAASAAKGAPTYAGSAAEKARAAEGWKLVRELPVDLTGDKVAERVVVERAKDGKMIVRALVTRGEADELAFEELYASAPLRADRLAKLEARELTGDRVKEVVVSLEEGSPDDLLQRVLILGQRQDGIGELFSQSFSLPKDDAIEGGAVALGDASPRFAIRDLPSEDGAPTRAELAWVRGPQTLTLGLGGKRANVVIGAYETLYTFDGARRAFVAGEAQRVVDFIPARKPYEVEASSQVSKVWGTAQAFWATDGNLETAWSVSTKARGEGEWLEVRFKQPVEVSLVRMVPGCTRDEDTWRQGNRLVAFDVELSNGQRASIDRAKLDALPRSLEGAGEFPLASGEGGGFGAQLILLFKERAPVRWARVKLTRVEPAAPAAPAGKRAVPKAPKGVDTETCISELSFH